MEAAPSLREGQVQAAEANQGANSNCTKGSSNPNNMRKSVSIIWLFIIILSLLLTLPLLTNPCLRLRSDGYHQVAIVSAILRSGIPPTNPFIAGEPLNYYWFYNAIVAALNKLSGIYPVMIMLALHLLCAFCLLAGFALSARQPNTAKRDSLAGLGVFAFGLNGWGWLFFLGHWLKLRFAPAEVFGARIWEFIPLLVCGYTPRVAFLGIKFLVINSMPASLVGCILCLFFIIRFLDRPRF